METTTNHLVLVSKSYGKTSVTIKKTSNSIPLLEGEKARLREHMKKTGRAPRDYRILTSFQLQKLLEKVSADRKKKGLAKAAATRARKAALGITTPKSFICCPSCGAKSKKLFSEFGGLQTRKCQNGHTFEYDKWLTDCPLLRVFGA